jgi:hypothetical protein
VTVWSKGGKLPDATVKLKAAPVSGGTPGFSSGCGRDDGTSSCDLGAVNASAAKRQLKVQLTVPVTATVNSVTLTVTGGAAQLSKAPQVSAAAVTITAPPAASQSALNPPAADTSPLPVGALPSIPAASPVLSPGGNAAGLFPTLSPTKPAPRPAPGSTSAMAAAVQGKSGTRPVANTQALPEDVPVVGAQLAGLAALAVAFLLAATRLTIRRRRPGAPGQRGKTGGPPADEPGPPGGPGA